METIQKQDEVIQVVETIAIRWLVSIGYNDSDQLNLKPFGSYNGGVVTVKRGLGELDIIYTSDQGSEERKRFELDFETPIEVKAARWIIEKVQE